jgi:hypothetical protein
VPVIAAVISEKVCLSHMGNYYYDSEISLWWISEMHGTATLGTQSGDLQKEVVRISENN